MQINFTLERETRRTVRCAEDGAGQPANHPDTLVVGALYIQTVAHPTLGAPNRIAVTIAAKG